MRTVSSPEKGDAVDEIRLKGYGSELPDSIVADCGDLRELARTRLGRPA
jgi:hypothetical protein